MIFFFLKKKNSFNIKIILKTSILKKGGKIQGVFVNAKWN